MGDALAALLTDLTFDCLPHDLLIAKLHAYGIKEGSLNFLFSYLKNIKQRVRLNNFYSEWIDILFVVPQGSTYAIFFCSYYTDDNTQYCTGLKISTVLTKVESATCSKLYGRQHPILYWIKNFNCSN